jgi:hypothetical protein
MRKTSLVGCTELRFLVQRLRGASGVSKLPVEVSKRGCCCMTCSWGIWSNDQWSRKFLRGDLEKPTRSFGTPNQCWENVTKCPTKAPQQLAIDRAYSMVRLQILGRAKAHKSLCDEHLRYCFAARCSRQNCSRSVSVRTQGLDPNASNLHWRWGSPRCRRNAFPQGRKCVSPEDRRSQRA